MWTAEALVRFGIGREITALVYGYFSLRFLLTARLFFPALLRALPLFFYPLVCLISVTWSIAPEVSFAASIQITMTILIGYFLGLQMPLRVLAVLICTTLGLTMILSLVNLGGAWGNVYSWEGGFLGIYTNKNALGQRAALLLLTCLFLGFSTGTWTGRLSVLVMLMVTTTLLIWSRSMTSLLVSLMFGAGFLGLLLYRGQTLLRPWIWLGAALVLATIMTLIISFDINPYTEVLALFGKSSTLTGRTVLWDIGLNKIAENPLLGKGAMAYWSALEFAQETQLISELYGSSVSAFHNFPIEILVMLGPLGLLAMLVLITTCLMWVYRSTRNAERIWAICVLIMLVGLSLLGSSLYRQHEITLLLIVAIGASARREMLLMPIRRGAQNT